MAKRLIGVEIADGVVRVAILEQHRGTVEVLALDLRQYTDVGELPGLIEAIVPGGFQLADRVATALPAGLAYVRTVQFPFREPRKILAAAPFVLSAQIPVALDECQVAVLAPRPLDGGAGTTAAAVPKADIDALLGPFDAARTPLHILDVMPYALAGGVGEMIGTGLLACLNEREATLSCLRNGELVSYRHFPLDAQGSTAETIGQLLLETALFSGQESQGYGQLLLTGALATPQLLAMVREQGLSAELFALTIGHSNIPPAFVPAAALALRAGEKNSDRCFNLRQGAYAYRGEAAVVKKTLIGLGGLLAASLLIFALATGLDYRDKNHQAESLHQLMVQQYRETFPGSEITVDVSLQMQSKLQELRNRAAALGIGSQPQALRILKELSTITARISYEVEDLSCDQGACSLTGRADTFDAVNRIKEQLGASTLFVNIAVGESRKSFEGNLVVFRMHLPFATRGGNP